MRLLVSVRGSVEARAAVAGGADVIDAKDPARGALGPVRRDRLPANPPAVGAPGPPGPAPGGAGDAAVVAGPAGPAPSGALRETRLRGRRDARAVGAELVGVRGAACVGGRAGRVSQARVAALQRLVRAAPHPTLPLGVLP